MKTRGQFLMVALLVGAFAGSTEAAAEPAVVLPPPAVDTGAAAPDGLQTAVIAGGCFWGIQAVYQHIEGVVSAVSGYSGGTKETAIYDIVAAGRTDHAEAVEIRFDPKTISFGQILHIFFSVAHDPTQLDQQGPDIGPQYRSAIFYVSAEQKRVAEAYIDQLDGLKVFDDPIVTRVDPLTAFYPAEAYHQDYLIKHPDNPYIVHHDLPKLENLKQIFAKMFRTTPVTVAGAAGK